jgi:hypothetical protein
MTERMKNLFGSYRGLPRVNFKKEQAKKDQTTDDKRSMTLLEKSKPEVSDFGNFININFIFHNFCTISLDQIMAEISCAIEVGYVIHTSLPSHPGNV